MPIISSIKRSFFNWPPKPWIWGFGLGILLNILSFVSDIISTFSGSVLLNVSIYQQMPDNAYYYISKGVLLGVIWSVVVSFLCSKNPMKIALAIIIFAANAMIIHRVFSL
ncbi:MAG: hypothetical protein PHX87_00950 [Candidatus Peribacteraceae bacterium]|nr:hypothetical protein [Candidatus Peribacteraceae bacterium]MDD5741977.1 hypothetical protein [Candidatus Peribacteraceae bacterium]